MFVKKQIGKQRMRPPYGAFRSFFINPDKDRQRVDEQAHHTIGSFSALHAPEQHGPKDHILTA